VIDARVGNIGPAGRRRRLALGLIMGTVGLGAVAALIVAGAAPGWVLAAFVPFWVGALGLIQARERT
jgi:hypothetical protein